MTTLYLVRHGESVWNADGIIQGQREAPGLTSRGRVQARDAAEALAPLGIRTLWCSDATRAVETAELIGERLGVGLKETPLLRERHWGSLQGAPTAKALPLEAALSDDEPLPDGGESRRDLDARVGAFLATLTGPAIAVTHGDVVAAIGRTHGLAVADGNAAITRVDL